MYGAWANSNEKSRWKKKIGKPIEERAKQKIKNKTKARKIAEDMWKRKILTVIW